MDLPMVLARGGDGVSWFAILGFTLVILIIVRLAIPRRATYVDQCDMCGAVNPRIANFCRQCGSRVRP